MAPKPEIKLKPITIRVAPETYRALAHAGADRDLDVAGAAKLAIEKFLVGLEADALIEKARRSDARSKRRSK